MDLVLVLFNLGVIPVTRPIDDPPDGRIFIFDRFFKKSNIQGNQKNFAQKHRCFRFLKNHSKINMRPLGGLPIGRVSGITSRMFKHVF